MRTMREVRDENIIESVEIFRERLLGIVMEMIGLNILL